MDQAQFSQAITTYFKTSIVQPNALYEATGGHEVYQNVIAEALLVWKDIKPN